MEISKDKNIALPAARLRLLETHQTSLWLLLGGLGAFFLWLYMLWAFRGQPGDDPYITFRYAANLASGNGFVFNLGERVQSTTTPLFTLMLALGGLLGLDIPTLGYFLSALCLLAFALCCIGLVSTVDGLSPWIGLGAAALTIICPVTTYGLGTEMPLLIALSWGAWLAAARDRWLLAGLIAGFAALARGDGILVGVSVALAFLWAHRKTHPRQWPWGAVLAFMLAVVPWYVFAWLYFGSPLPATLGAKLAQGNAPGAVSFFEGLGVFWVRTLGDTVLVWSPALVVLVIGFAAMLRRGGALLAPALWAIMVITAFGFLRYPRYPWYYSPIAPVALLALLIGGREIAAFLARRISGGKPIANYAAIGALAVFLAVGSVFLYEDVQAQRPRPKASLQLYMDVGVWLSANTPVDASVGSEEVGLLGYHSKRRIIDFVGLIQPPVIPYRIKGDNLWAVQTYQPDYIAALPAWMGAVGGNAWVTERYSLLRTFDYPGADSVTLLKKN